VVVDNDNVTVDVGVQVVVLRNSVFLSTGGILVEDVLNRWDALIMGVVMVVVGTVVIG